AGAGAKVTGTFRPVTQDSFFEKPAGRRWADPKVTVMRDHADTLPAASRARVRMMCWPDECTVLSPVTEYGALVTSLPTVWPSSWNSTPTTLTLSVAVADRVSV